jgi:hypothetical protein
MTQRKGKEGVGPDRAGVPPVQWMNQIDVGDSCMVSRAVGEVPTLVLCVVEGEKKANART